MSRVADAVRETGTSLSTVFANPGLRRLNLAFAGSAIGDWAYATAIVVWAYEVGGVTAVGIWGTVRLILMTLVTPFASTLVDRLPRKLIMVSTDLIRAAICLVVAGLIWADAPPITVFVLASSQLHRGRTLPPGGRRPDAEAGQEARGAHGRERYGEHDREPGVLPRPSHRRSPGRRVRRSGRGPAERRDVRLVGGAGQPDQGPQRGPRGGCGRAQRRRGPGSLRRPPRGHRGGGRELLHRVHGRVQDDLGRQGHAHDLGRLLRADCGGRSLARVRRRDGRPDDGLRHPRHRLPGQRHGGGRPPGRTRRDRPGLGGPPGHRLRRGGRLLGASAAAHGDLAGDVGRLPGHVHHRCGQPDRRRQRHHDHPALGIRRGHGPRVRGTGDRADRRHGPRLDR